MSRLRALLCGLLLAANALLAHASGVAKQNFGRPLAVPLAPVAVEWPELTGRAGPYGGLATDADARAMTADGFNLAVLSAPSAVVVKPLREAGVKYIDAHLWRLLFDVCQQQYAAAAAAGQARSCAIAPLEQATILAQAATYLKLVEREPALAGFWTLDDYPQGDVTPTLRGLRELVQQSNARSGFHRPAICGVGGSLDFKRHLEDSAFTRDRRYFDQAMGNVSPAACDLVGPYFYGSASANDARLIDWSMTELAPYVQAALRSRGYPAAAQVMVPVAHAFSHQGVAGATSYVKPEADDLTGQMRAYCDSGAIAMLFFTWQSPDAERSYANDPDLRDGVRKGRLGCVKVWRTRFGV